MWMDGLYDLDDLDGHPHHLDYLDGHLHHLGYLDGRPSPPGLPGCTTFRIWMTRMDAFLTWITWMDYLDRPVPLPLPLQLLPLAVAVVFQVRKVSIQVIHNVKVGHPGNPGRASR